MVHLVQQIRWPYWEAVRIPCPGLALISIWAKILHSLWRARPAKRALVTWNVFAKAESCLITSNKWVQREVQLTIRNSKSSLCYHRSIWVKDWKGENSRAPYKIVQFSQLMVAPSHLVQQEIWKELNLINEVCLSYLSNTTTWLIEVLILWSVHNNRCNSINSRSPQLTQWQHWIQKLKVSDKWTTYSSSLRTIKWCVTPMSQFWYTNWNSSTKNLLHPDTRLTMGLHQWRRESTILPVQAK